VIGVLLDDWDTNLRKLGLKRVYGLQPGVRMDDADGIYLGDLIVPDMTCPACGVGIEESVEVEYSDRCKLCGNEPNEFAWYWNESRKMNLSICEACERSPAGEKWIRELDEGG
jgi:hypothetical protein